MKELCKLKITGTVWSITFLLLLHRVEDDSAGSACVVMWAGGVRVSIAHWFWFFSPSLSLSGWDAMLKDSPLLSDMISFCTASRSPKWIMTVPCLRWGRTPTLNCVITLSCRKVACGGPRIPVREWPPWWVGLIQPVESIARIPWQSFNIITFPPFSWICASSCLHVKHEWIGRRLGRRTGSKQEQKIIMITAHICRVLCSYNVL